MIGISIDNLEDIREGIQMLFQRCATGPSGIIDSEAACGEGSSGALIAGDNDPMLSATVVITANDHGIALHELVIDESHQSLIHLAIDGAASVSVPTEAVINESVTLEAKLAQHFIGSNGGFLIVGVNHRAGADEATDLLDSTRANVSTAPAAITLIVVRDREIGLQVNSCRIAFTDYGGSRCIQTAIFAVDPTGLAAVLNENPLISIDVDFLSEDFHLSPLFYRKGHRFVFIIAGPHRCIFGCDRNRLGIGCGAGRYCDQAKNCSGEENEGQDADNLLHN